MVNTNKKKKGFTIVELVIVIAVIAVLAAVLIPTFANLIKKANESADIQAVRQMNTHLAIDGIGEGTDTIADVMEALQAENLELDNYKPLIKDRSFYWVKSINKIVYVDASNKVLYPEECKDLTKTAGDWWALTGEIKKDDSWKSTVDTETKTVEINYGEKFVSVIDAVSKNDSSASQVETIKLTDNVDLAGSTVKFSKNIKQDIIIDGNNKELVAFRDDNNSIFGAANSDFADKGYGYGLFAEIPYGVTVTIKNVVLSNMVVKDTSKTNGTMGLIAGYVRGTLNMENVTIKDSYVEASTQKCGGIVGQLIGGTLNMKDVKMENVTVVAPIEAAKIAGYASDVYTDANQTSVARSFKINITHTEDGVQVPGLLADSITVKAPATGTEGYAASWADSYGVCPVNTIDNNNGTYLYAKYNDTSYAIWGALTQEYYWKNVAKPSRSTYTAADGHTYTYGLVPSSANIA